MASNRKILCVKDKVAIIRAIENGEKKMDVGRRLGLSSSTVATIWKSKEKILEANLQGISNKKLRKPKFENLEHAMQTWYLKQRHNNVTVSGTILKAKAQKFALLFSITGFKASEGWLQKFKKRHELKFLNSVTEGQQPIKEEIKEERSADETITSSPLEGEPFSKINPPIESDPLSTTSSRVSGTPSIQEAVEAVRLLERFLLFNKDNLKLS